MIETLVALVGLALLMWRRELHWKMFGFLLVMAAWAESTNIYVYLITTIAAAYLAYYVLTRL
ncbi:MAG: hypothetical protein QXT27_01610 [Pyrobaculum sp.]